MAHRKPTDQWQPQRPQALPQNLLHAEVAGEHIVVGPAETTETDPGHPTQQAAGAPLGEQTIDPIGGLTRVLDHQNGPAQIR